MNDTDVIQKIKISIIGATDVGKTTIARALKDHKQYDSTANKFIDKLPSPNATYGADVFDMKIPIHSILSTVSPVRRTNIQHQFSDNDNVYVNLWDTEGYELHNKLPPPIILNGAHVIIVCFSTSCIKSINKAMELLHHIEKCGNTHKKCVYIALGNKTDLMVESVKDLLKFDKNTTTTSNNKNNDTLPSNDLSYSITSLYNDVLEITNHNNNTNNKIHLSNKHIEGQIGWNGLHDSSILRRVYSEEQCDYFISQYNKSQQQQASGSTMTTQRGPFISASSSLSLSKCANENIKKMINEQLFLDNIESLINEKSLLHHEIKKNENQHVKDTLLSFVTTYCKSFCKFNPVFCVHYAIFVYLERIYYDARKKHKTHMISNITTSEYTSVSKTLATYDSKYSIDDNNNSNNNNNNTNGHDGYAIPQIYKRNKPDTMRRIKLEFDDADLNEQANDNAFTCCQ